MEICSNIIETIQSILLGLLSVLIIIATLFLAFVISVFIYQFFKNKVHKSFLFLIVFVIAIIIISIGDILCESFLGVESLENYPEVLVTDFFFFAHIAALWGVFCLAGIVEKKTKKNSLALLTLLIGFIALVVTSNFLIETLPVGDRLGQALESLKGY